MSGNVNFDSWRNASVRILPPRGILSSDATVGRKYNIFGNVRIDTIKSSIRDGDIVRGLCSLTSISPIGISIIDGIFIIITMCVVYDSDATPIAATVFLGQIYKIRVYLIHATREKIFYSADSSDVAGFVSPPSAGARSFATCLTGTRCFLNNRSASRLNARFCVPVLHRRQPD